MSEFNLYEVSVCTFDYEENKNFIFSKCIVGEENACYIAKAYKKAENVKSVLIIDAFTGEIIDDFT